MPPSEAEMLAEERALRRSKGIADEHEVAALLSTYSLVTVGGSVRVVRWVPRHLYDGDTVQELDMLRTDAFRTLFEGRFCTVKVDGEDKKVPLAKHLINRMRRYGGLVFLPNGAPAIDGKLNLWRGFGLVPAEGKWPLMEAHIREVLASGDRASAQYILRWLAWTAQNPDKRAEVALVLRGAKGTGKGVLGNTMCRIFGAHGVHISNRKHLVSGFNRHLMHCSFLFCDEAFWPGDHSAEGELKRLITEPTLWIEPKGLDGFAVRNCLHPLIVGNAEWVVPASADERRFAVFDIDGERPQSRAYFDALHLELDNGGREAMLYDLLHMELGDWHPRQDIPQTAALFLQKEESLSGIDVLVADLLREGCLPYPMGDKPDVCITAGEAEGTGLWAYAKRTVPSLRHSSATVMSTALKKRWQCARYRKAMQRGLRFPPLPELRQLYVARFGPQEWEDEGNWGQ